MHLLKLNNKGEANNEAGLMMIGGVIIFIAACYALMKAAEKALDEASRFFDSVAHGMSSFFVMLFQIGKVATEAMVIAAAIAATIYVTYKYIMLIRRVVGIREEFVRNSDLLRNDIETRCTSLESELRRDFRVIQGRIDELLKPPAPMPPPTDIAGAEKSEIIDHADDDEPLETQDSEETESHLDSDGELQEFEASNPY